MDEKRPRGRPPTKQLKSVEGMVQEMREAERTMNPHTKKNQPFDLNEEKKQVLSQDIRYSITALQKAMARGRVNLNDIDEVYSRTMEYFEACAQAGRYPSLMGLYSTGFGYNRSGVNLWKDKHPGTPTTIFLETVKEMIADLLTNESLNGNANVIQVIFQLKNHFDHADKIEVRPSSQDSEQLNADEVRRKYGVVMEVDPEQ